MLIIELLTATLDWF